MKLETAALLRALNLAKPCLGSNDAILPILSHFCFAGDIVYAWNDVCAVIVEFETGLNCALHGDTLTALLEAAGSDSVEFRVPKDGPVEMRCGAGWVKLPSLPLTDSSFSVPDEETLVEMALTDDVLTGLERCMISVGEDSLKPEFAGVTVDYGRGKLTFYSSDNKTASRYEPAGKFISRKAVSTSLPVQACSLLLKLAATVDNAEELTMTLAIGEKAAVATIPGVTLISRLLAADVEMFAGMFKTHTTAVTGTMPLPEGLDKEIAKAAVVCGRDAVRECFFTFAGGKVAVEAQGSLGHLSASFKIANAKFAAEACVDPLLFQRILPMVDHWSCNDGRSLVFAGGSFVHVLSSANTGRREKPTPTKAKPAEEFEDDIPF